MLQPLRHVGFDLQQHEMIDIYLASRATTVWDIGGRPRRFSLDVLRTVRAVAPSALGGWRHRDRGLSRDAHEPTRDLCARLLGKAADIRERMRLPLFSFWVAHDKEAAQAVRAATRQRSIRYPASRRRIGTRRARHRRGASVPARGRRGLRLGGGCRRRERSAQTDPSGS